MQLHSKTVALPDTETAFTGQALHAVLAPVENVFAGQAAQEVALVKLPYVPAAQPAHVLRSDCNMYPGAHLHVPGTVPYTCTSSNCSNSPFGT